MPRFTDDDRDEIIRAVLGSKRLTPERSIPLDAMTVDAGIEREKEPCACGKPRSTLLVPANSVTWTSKKAKVERTITETMSVTICMACDGGIEWRQS